VSRALGIPCRVVTNFSSAHDTDANLVIEKLYDEDGERISDDDSVWSVHVPKHTHPLSINHSLQKMQKKKRRKKKKIII